VSLFASGEEGALFLPGPTTSFLSTTDLTPAGAGDTVGFQLDTSQGAGYSGGSFTGLGSELVTNGTFDTDITGWTAVGSSLALWDASGYLDIRRNGRPINAQGATSPITCVVGNTYFVDFQIVSASHEVQFSVVTDPNDISGTGVTNITNLTAGTYSLVFTATATTHYVAFRNILSTGATATIDNISVRELPGNHATQTNPDARPVLARVPSGGRRNLLSYTEELDNAAWIKVTGTVSANTDGVADELKEPASGTSRVQIRQDSVALPEIGKDYTFRLKIKEVTSTPKRYLAVASSSLNFGSQCIVIFDPADGSVTYDNGNGGTPTTSGPDVDGYFTVTITDTATNGSDSIGFIVYGTDSASSIANYSCSGASIAYVKEAQLEEASTATAYQKVVSEYDVTEAGVDSLWYLDFDGVDDSLAFEGSWFNSTDVTMAAGYKEFGLMGFAKNSVDNDRYVIIDSAVNGNRASYAFNTASRPSSTLPYDSPSVVFGFFDATAKTATVRSNGVDGTESAAAAGVVSDANIFSIGRVFRNISPLTSETTFFGGIAIDRVLTTQEISDTETFLADRSGVTL
jgi:hypothetical protein